MLKKLKSFNWGYFLVALLLILVGSCFIAFNNTFTVLALAIGLLTTVFGIVIGVTAMAKKIKGFAFGTAVAAAVICIICGFITAALREKAVGIIADVMCLLLIMDGAFKVQTAASSKRFKVVGWWLMLSAAVAVVISAFVITKYFTATDENMTGYSTAIGIVIIADGVSNLFAAFFTTLNEKRSREEIIKVLDKEEAPYLPAEESEPLPEIDSDICPSELGDSELPESEESQAEADSENEEASEIESGDAEGVTSEEEAAESEEEVAEDNDSAASDGGESLPCEEESEDSSEE